MTEAPDQYQTLMSRLRDDPALSGLLKEDAAVLVWDAAADKLLWTSPAAADFGAGLLDEGGRLDPGSRARRRLEALAGGLAPQQGVRLERLLLDPARLSPPLTCACRLAELPDGTNVLVTVIVGKLPEFTRNRRREAAIQPAEAPKPMGLPTGGSIRFVWQADPSTRFINVSAGLSEAVGPMAADILGQTWAQVSGSVAEDPNGEIADNFARQQTWSGRPISWSVDNKSGKVPVEWAGMPIFGSDRELVGFRGFGLVRRDAVESLEEFPLAAGLASNEEGEILPLGDIDEPDALEAPDAGIMQVVWPEQRIAPDEAESETSTSEEATDNAPELLEELDPEAMHAAWPVDASHSSEPPLAELEEPAPEDEPDPADAVVQEPPPPEVELVLPVPYRALTAEEKLFEQLRETVAASLSEPTIEIYHQEEEDQASEPEPDLEDFDLEIDAEPGTTLPTAPVLPFPGPQGGLSNTERNAFREIARALGAKFEPVPTPAPKPSPYLPRSAFQTVTLVPQTVVEPTALVERSVSNDAEETFAETVAPSPAEEILGAASEEPSNEGDQEPLSGAETEPQTGAETSPERSDSQEEAAIVHVPAVDGREILARLPIPTLVHQGEHVVFANAALLALAGYDDREHLAAAGGLPRIIGSVPNASTRSATLATRQRESVPVELRTASITWEGVGADLLVVRRLPEGDTSLRLQSVEEEVRVRDRRIHELESVLDTATDGVVVLDETGRIVSLNRSGEALFGYNQAEVVGDAITVLFSPESHIVALDYIEGLRSPGVASLLNDGREVFGRVRQGGTIPLFMTMGHVNDGPERKLCAVLRDITAFKKAEGELVGARRAAEQANAQKSDLLAKISHEIRTPLNAILGFAEVMLEERFGPIGNERYKEYMKDVHASGAHVISLVNDLLDLAKIEAGRMELSFTSVSLNDLVSSCFTLLQPQAARDRIVMRTSFAPKLPPVVADDRSVRQIVLNLVSNAIKFTDAGGQVIVSTALTDRGEVAFRVRDTGIGMSETEVEAALEPFRQLATSRKRGGTGLGLPLTKALVEANRGALQISSHPNEGTLVEVIFPPTRVLAE